MQPRAGREPSIEKRVAAQRDQRDHQRDWDVVEDAVGHGLRIERIHPDVAQRRHEGHQHPDREIREEDEEDD